MTDQDKKLCCDLGAMMERVKAIPNREGVEFLVDLFLAVIEAEGLTVVEKGEVVESIWIGRQH